MQFAGDLTICSSPLVLTPVPSPSGEHDNGFGRKRYVGGKGRPAGVHRSVKEDVDDRRG